MKYFKRFVFLGLLIILNTSCSKEDELNVDISDCLMLSNIEIISEEVRFQTSMFYDVYNYQNEIYTVLVCPLCFVPLAPIANNCDGDPLCSESDDCMDQFFEKAIYQFSYTQN